MALEPEGEVAMAKETATVTACGVTREVVRDTKTGESTRRSESADRHVNNGTQSSMAGAKAEAKADIGRGTRSYGDTSYRGK